MTIQNEMQGQRWSAPHRPQDDNTYVVPLEINGAKIRVVECVCGKENVIDRHDWSCDCGRKYAHGQIKGNETFPLR